jgi:hypothetical protein
MRLVSCIPELPQAVGPIRGKKGVASMRHWARMAVTTRLLGGNNQQGYELENEDLLTEQRTLAVPRSGHNA